MILELDNNVSELTASNFQEIEMAEELLPCPFCGTSAEVGSRNDNYFKIICHNRCIQMPRLPNVGFKSKGEAIKTWNTRP